jgi:uncharacterized protein
MTRDDAYQLLSKYLTNKNLLKHSFAAEAGMKGIHKHLHPMGDKKEEVTWGITGLLHDIDYELAQKTDQLDKHGVLIFEKVPNTIPDNIAQAIKAHNFEGTKIDPVSDMEWAIAIVDGLTGFIVACALVHPDKKLASLSPDFILKRLKQPAFSRNVRRDTIALCESKLNIPLETFVGITLLSMQEIHEELGL